jgi:hypothetical protein
VERISGVLQAAGYSASALALPPSSDQQSPAVGAGTAASWGRTAAPKVRGPWLAVGAAVGVVVVGAWLFIARSQTGAPASASAAGTGLLSAAPTGTPSVEHEQSAEEAPPSEAPLIVPATSENAARTPSQAPLPSAAAPTPAVAARHAHAGAPAIREKPPAAAEVQPARKPNCDPNYYLDAQGEKHFKPECFAK